MHILGIIDKKKYGQELTPEEIRYFVNGYVNDEIKDYQMSSLLMAILLNGMSERETVALTREMLYSGDTLDLSEISGFKVDKHSTGGIGDKVSLIAGPALAALGVPVAKMSGRGLGVTGGTIDKLESVKGFNTRLDIRRFIRQVNDIKIALISQAGNLVPADKKLYALRDVTGTVDSIPLIASSVMSKKLACGADGIVLDVKVGSGAFMKNMEQAKLLALAMINIGRAFGKKVTAILTGMDAPLGRFIGNKLEVVEAYEFLSNPGKAEKSLYEVCVCVAAHMLAMAKPELAATAQAEVEKVLHEGAAKAKFEQWIAAQGGELSDIKFPSHRHVVEVRSQKEGYISNIAADNIGTAALFAGAGRKELNDKIDYDAGIELVRLIGGHVKTGDTLARLYCNTEGYEEALELIRSAYSITGNEPEPQKPVIAVLQP